MDFAVQLNEQCVGQLRRQYLGPLSDGTNCTEKGLRRRLRHDESRDSSPHETHHVQVKRRQTDENDSRSRALNMQCLGKRQAVVILTPLAQEHQIRFGPADLPHVRCGRAWGGADLEPAPGAVSGNDGGAHRRGGVNEDDGDALPHGLQCESWRAGRQSIRGTVSGLARRNDGKQKGLGLRGFAPPASVGEGGYFQAAAER